MDLHRADKKPDWVKDEEAGTPLNRHQKVARWSHGILTRANGISITGGGMMVGGVYIYTQGNRVAGVIVGGTGCLLDKTDGWDANRKRVKSAIGEFVDAAKDKVAILAGAAILAKQGDIVPAGALLAVGAQNAVNIVASVVAKARGHEPHPSEFGKYNAASQYAGIGGFMAAEAVAPGTFQAGLEVVGWAGTVASTATLGLVASGELIATAIKRNPQPNQSAPEA